ncbi:MAG: hypothetical protein LUG27_05455 [Clostridiales bacterium]|nr:hypothetical protein [Clostridiales bacterium]
MTKIKVVTQGDKSVKVKPATVVQKRMAEIAIQGYAQAYADREHKRLKAERIRNWNMLGQVYNSCGSGGGYCYTSSGNRVDTGQYRSRLRDDRPGL